MAFPVQEEQRYKVLSKLAAGGMAEVFRGESTGIEGFCKKVAIKRVLPHLSEKGDFIAMFLDEARLGAYLSHSRCVQVFDIGQAAGAHFIVMEYVDGADLKGVLDYLAARGRLMPVEVACQVCLQVCEGLSYAHGAADHDGNPLNIVHRDISPHNVLMTRHGEVKLVDFGLAKASSHLGDEDEDIVKGKFGYLAPEVTLGQGADHRVDLFATGILLWEMLTGRRLFQGSTDLETFKLVQAAKIPDPRQYRGDLPEPLLRVLLKALARDPAERWQDADAFAMALCEVMLRSVPPVSYIDLGKLVREAAEARDRDDARAGRAEDRSSAFEVMGELILETLHDFSSVADETLDQDSRFDTAALAPGGGEPSGREYVDPSAWGFDADLGGFLDDPDSTSPPRESADPRPTPDSAPSISVGETLSLLPEFSDADVVSIAPRPWAQDRALPPPPPRHRAPTSPTAAREAHGRPPQAAGSTTPASTTASMRPAHSRPAHSQPAHSRPAHSRAGTSAAERARAAASTPSAQRPWWKLW